MTFRALDTARRIGRGREPVAGGASGGFFVEGSVQLSYLATLMGTSVRELEDTYFRWLQRTDERVPAAFDAYDAAHGR